MTFLVTDVQDRQYLLSEILSFEMNKSMYVPCHSLYVEFLSPLIEAELKGVRAFRGEKMVFDGVVDCQRIRTDSRGTRESIQARSTAAKLVDSECEPCTYNGPGTAALVRSICGGMGFESRLPNVCTQGVFRTAKGTSCWGALRAFLKTAAAGELFVSEENALCIYAPTGRTVDLESLCVSALKTVRRSGTVSRVLYKIGADGYRHHADCEDLIKKGIDTARYLNVSALERTQHRGAAEKIIKDSVRDYIQFEVTAAGEPEIELYDRAAGIPLPGAEKEPLYVRELSVLRDTRGSRTQLLLSPEEKTKENFYVD